MTNADGLAPGPITGYGPTAPRTAAGRALPEPSTRHGRYVYNLSRLHGWAAFDVNDILAIEAEAAAPLRERIDLAKDALVRTGYFTEAQVGDDIAPRITELWSAHPLRDALRGLVEAEDAVILVNAKWANDDHGSETERDFEAVEKQVDAAWDAARRALDEPIEHPVLDREVEG